MKLRKWLTEYDRLAAQFAEQHFGGWDGVLRLFTYMDTPDLSWPADAKEFPFDVYLVRKMANEYHGLERHANQYHATEQYEYSYQHWLMAASWRHENMELNRFTDERHLRAVDFDLRCASYNKALHEWHWDRYSPRRMLPQPYHFGLKSSSLEKKISRANQEIADAVGKANERESR